MAIDVLTRMREAIGGARMKELGAWLGVNQSVLSDRIRRNTMPTRRLRLVDAGTGTIHLGSCPGRGKSTGKRAGSLRQRKSPLGQEAAYAKRHDRVRPRLWPFELPLVTLSSSWRGFPFVSKWPEDRAEGLGVGFIHLKPIAQRLACFHLSVKWSIGEKRNTPFFSCQNMALHPMAQAGKGYGCSIRRKAR